MLSLLTSTFLVIVGYILGRLKKEVGPLSSTATSFKDYAVRKRLSQILHHVNVDDKVVLDVGCGNGIYTLSLATYAKQVIGIDINKKALHEAIKNQVKSGISNVNFSLMSAEAIGFKKDHFDAVVCIETLEHIEKEREALREIRKILKSEGKLICYVPNKFYPFETHGMRIGNFSIDHPLIPLFSYAPNFIRRRCERARIYTLKKILLLLRDFGYKVDAIDYMFPPLDRLKNNALKRTLKRIFACLERTKLKIFAMSIFVVATKSGEIPP